MEAEKYINGNIVRINENSMHVNGITLQVNGSGVHSMDGLCMSIVRGISQLTGSARQWQRWYRSMKNSVRVNRNGVGVKENGVRDNGNGVRDNGRSAQK